MARQWRDKAIEMDAKTIGILLSIVGPAVTFIAWAFPDAKVSRVLMMSFGPSPTHLETRSSFLMRQAAFAAVWLVFLIAVSGAIFISVQQGLLAFHSDAALAVVSFFLFIGIGMAAFSMVGAVLWAFVLRLFRIDWMYVLKNEPQDGVINEVRSGHNG